MRNAFVSRQAIAVALSVLLAPAVLGQAVDTASDAAYSGGWSNGSNGGTGFQPWILNPPVNGSSGFFVFNSNNNGGGGGPGINTPTNVAWGTYGNSGNNAAATRPFVASLAVGQTFGASIDNGFIDPGSSVGFSLADSSGTPRFTFRFVGGATNYEAIGASPIDTGIGFTDGGLRTAIDLTGPDTFLFTVTRLADNQTFQTAGTLGGTGGAAIDRFIAFNNNAGFNSSNDTYFNSISIQPVPEPATVLLICGMATSAYAVRRRFKNSAA